MVVGVGTALCFLAGSDLLRARRSLAPAQGLYGGTAMAGAGLLLPQVAHEGGWRASWISAAVVAACALVVVVPTTARVRAGTRPPASGGKPAFRIRDRRLYREAGAAGALTLFGGIVSRPLGGWIAEQRPHPAWPAIADGLIVGAMGTAALLLEPPFALGVLAAAAVGIGAGVPFGTSPISKCGPIKLDEGIGCVY